MRQSRLLPWIRKTTGVLFLVVVAVPATATAQDQQLLLGSTLWSPFTDEHGSPRFALDLVEEALKRIGISAGTIIVEEGTLTPALVSDKFDGSAALWKNSERERTLLFSQPYLENRLILVGRRGGDVSATSLDDLAGKRIALVTGYAYGEAVRTAEGLIVVASHDGDDSVAKLLHGEVDYTLMDDLVIQFLLRDHAEAARARLAFGSTPLVTRSLHLAVQRSLPDAEEIISRFNAELGDMIADRSYHRLLQLDWIRADIDGDGRREFVPHDDQIGPHQPKHAYELFVTASPNLDFNAPSRFYFDGDIYEGWSAVPDQYKALPDIMHPEPRRTTRLFTITF